MIKVLIADDHALIRKGLKHIIQEQTDMMVVGEATNGQEALDMVLKAALDVLVLDISLPVRNGLEVLQEMRNSKSDLPVLILSVYPEDQFGIRALKAGATGYLNKALAPDELVPAIRNIISGGKYVSQRLAGRLASELRGDVTKTPHERLSGREYDVMRRIGIGKTIGNIASELLLSVETVSTYRARILNKLGLKSNAALVRYTVEHNLLKRRVSSCYRYQPVI